jgi:putative ABC transport system permease protein
VVAKRTREMGLRLALGAEPGRLARLVLRDGFRPVVEGLLLGFAAAWVLRQLVQTSLTGRLSSVDVTTAALAAAPLLVAALVACWLPARQAARVDPNVALRDL